MQLSKLRRSLSARDLLQTFTKIEKDMGRKREVKGGPRIIDLDLLFYGQDVIRDRFDCATSGNPQTALCFGTIM